MAWWLVLILCLLSAIAGGILGFIIAKTIIKKQIKKNPPITDKQIRAMYMSMGRKPSEADIRKTMNAFKRGV